MFPLLPLSFLAILNEGSWPAVIQDSKFVSILALFCSYFGSGNNACLQWVMRQLCNFSYSYRKAASNDIWYTPNTTEVEFLLTLPTLFKGPLKSLGVARSFAMKCFVFSFMHMHCYIYFVPFEWFPL